MGACAFVGGTAVASGLLALAASLTWIVRIVIGASAWIKDGAWPEYSVLQWLFDISVRPPQTDLLGIQKIINWVLAQSLTGTVFFAALLFYCLARWLGIAMGWCLEERERVKRLQEREEERRRRGDPPELSLEDLVRGWDKQDDPLGLRSPAKKNGNG